MYPVRINPLKRDDTEKYKEWGRKEWSSRALIWWQVSRHEEGKYLLQSTGEVADLGYLCVCLIYPLAEVQRF